MKHITSRDNAHFRELKKLCQSSRERRKSGKIALEGMHLVESYAERFGRPEEVVLSETGQHRPEITAFLQRHGAGWPVTVLTDALFNELAEVETPSGIMAVAMLPQGAAKPDGGKDAVLLDGIQDPGNLGSILRTAAAAGVRQVLLSPDCVQAWSPKVLRAGMGAHFALDIHENGDLPVFLGSYRGLTVATVLEASSGLYSLDLKSAVAWIFGSEGQGIRPEVLQEAGQRARIPMPGTAESLNVGAAAAICLFEMVRQRSITP